MKDIKDLVVRTADLIMRFNGYNSKNIDIDELFAEAEKQLMFVSFSEFEDKMDSLKVGYNYSCETGKLNIANPNNDSDTFCCDIVSGITDIFIASEDFESALDFACMVVGERGDIDAE